MTTETRQYNPAYLEPDTRFTARLAIGAVAAFVSARLLLHFLTVAFTPYEIHRDEFLYLAMGEHLRLWGMDFPPMIAVLARVARGLFGDNLFAVRFFPALAGAALVAFAAVLSREFGGGRTAQALAMLCTFFPPVFMRPASLFQPVVLDQLCWTAGYYALVKVLQEPRMRWWVLMGCVCGLGLLIKFSILFFAFGVLVAVLLSPQRRLFLSRGPWIALAAAIVIGSPTLVGQVRLGFPVVIHMTDLRTHQLHRVTYSDFLTGQLLMVGVALLVAVAGIVYLLAAPEGRRFRTIAVACLTSFVLLMVLRGKPYYIAPVYPVLFGAGAVAMTALRGVYRRYGIGLTLVLVSAAGVICLPFGVPILPPEPMAGFAARLGIQRAVTTNRGTVLPLPQDYADMLGWEEQVKAVARAYESLPPDKRERVGLIANNYGKAGALEFYGPRYGLPRRIMLPQNFLLWPADPSCEIVLVLGSNPEDVRRFFQEVTVLGEFDHPWMVDEERRQAICLGEKPIRDIAEAWTRP